VNIYAINVGLEKAKDFLSGAKVVPLSNADVAKPTGRSLTSYVAIMNLSLYCFSGLCGFWTFLLRDVSRECF